MIKSLIRVSRQHLQYCVCISNLHFFRAFLLLWGGWASVPTSGWRSQHVCGDKGGCLTLHSLGLSEGRGSGHGQLALHFKIREIVSFASFLALASSPIASLKCLRVVCFSHHPTMSETCHLSVQNPSINETCHLSVQIWLNSFNESTFQFLVLPIVTLPM